MRWSVSRNPAGRSDGGVGIAICAAVPQMSTCGVGKSHSPVLLGVYVVACDYSVTSVDLWAEARFVLCYCPHHGVVAVRPVGNQESIQISS
jgi:hypothetical protein